MGSILIKNSIVFTMRGEGLGVIEDGGIYVEDDEIVYVGSTSEVLQRGYKGDYVIDGEHSKVVLPGFVDCHIHTRHTLVRGLAQDVPEAEWMHKTIFPFSSHYREEYLIPSTMLSIVEGVKYGTTTFSDYDYPVKPALEKAYIPLGLRVVATPTINAIPESPRLSTESLYPFDDEKAYRRLEENLRLFKEYHGKLGGRVHVLFGPQAVDMIPLHILKEIFSKAKEVGALLHMHVAQGGREQKQIMGRYGVPTVSLLAREGMLGSDLIAVHCHYASEEELKLMAERGVRMVSCPSSIAVIDGIVPPLARYIKYGGLAGLGTDQAPGNNNQNILAELKVAALLNKTKEGDPTVLPAWKVLRVATIEGARVLGIDKYVGSIEPGKKADLVVFSLKHPTLTPKILWPVRNVAHNIVYAARGEEVEYVVVNGKVVKENYKLTFVNEEEVLREAQKAAEKLVREAGQDYLAAKSLMVKEFEKGLF
ncbi:MAG: amidohydrolase [Desulfurococcaceae archaeon]